MFKGVEGLLWTGVCFLIHKDIHVLCSRELKACTVMDWCVFFDPHGYTCNDFVYIWFILPVAVSTACVMM